MYLRSILLSTGTSLFCRQFQGALWGREDRLAPITFSHPRCEVLLRSTFQRSRGIIVKRLSPFSLERTFAPSSLMTLLRRYWSFTPSSFSHDVHSSYVVAAYCVTALSHCRSFICSIRSLPSLLIRFATLHSMPFVALSTLVHSATLRSLPFAPLSTDVRCTHCCVRHSSVAPHCLTATQRAPVAHAISVTVLERRD